MISYTVIVKDNASTICLIQIIINVNASMGIWERIVSGWIEIIKLFRIKLHRFCNI